METLIQRVTDAMEKYLANAERITKFVKNLNAETSEERSFAFVEINRSRHRAAPYLIEALQTNFGTALHSRIEDALVRLDPEVVTAMLEVLKARDAKDAQSAELRLTLLDVIRQRAQREGPRQMEEWEWVRRPGINPAIHYLWHLFSAKQYPEVVRAKARDTLAFLLQTDPSKLMPAKAVLAFMAENYYQHKVRFLDPEKIKIWRWDGKKLAIEPDVLTKEQAEEYFGLRYAREALELDPAYQPAQIVFLNLLLERTLAPDLDQFVLQARDQKLPPNLQQLLGSIDGELLTTVLERALSEDKLPVILGAVQALGERGEVRAARLGDGGGPRGIVKALYYPDRRVQLTAARAMVKMPAGPAPVAAARIVEVLRRNLAAEPTPKALIGFVPTDKAADVRKSIQAAGFKAELVANNREAFAKLGQGADYEFILLHRGLPDSELPFTLAQLRGDSDHGRLPLLVVTSKARDERLKRLTGRYQQVHLVPEVLLGMPNELKTTLEQAIKQAAGAPLLAEERKSYPRLAMDLLWRMARQEIPGYNVRPAQDAVLQALANEEVADMALEILGRLPGAEVQQRLAGVVLDPQRGKLRVSAAIELNRHMQKQGVLLQPRQSKDLKTAYDKTDEDAALRAQLALVLGNLRPSLQVTGQRLQRFVPDPPAKKEEKKEEKKL